MIKNTLRQLSAIAILAFGFTTFAQAVPTLQLDIGGGYYDATDETITTNSSVFDLYALVTPGSVLEVDILADQYFLSIAVTPSLADASNLGFITVNGITIDVTADMLYGTPPNDAMVSPDLPGHGIYDTYYAEIDFMLDESNTSSTYNTQDENIPGQRGTGAGPDTDGTGSFYEKFVIDASNLDPSIGLHFDLYTLAAKNGSTELDAFAPFSHDAAMVRVPEASSIALLGLGLLGLGFAARRRG